GLPGKLQDLSQEDKDLLGMATTLVLFYVDPDDKFTLRWVGDSRGYRRDTHRDAQGQTTHTTTQLTRDHTRRGEISYAIGEDTRGDSLREGIATSVVEGTFDENSTYILCTDGVSGGLCLPDDDREREREIIAYAEEQFAND